MAEVIARVIEENGKVEGGLVELSNGETNLTGRVAAVSNNEFLVNWEDGARTVENQSDYELVVEARTAAENPAQPAGWAVPPVDADAYPGGELSAIEMEKRNDTAAWEDSQNRPPMDGENPAQPAGFAVPPATGGPILGQGADGLVMSAKEAASPYANEICRHCNQYMGEYHECVASNRTNQGGEVLPAQKHPRRDPSLPISTRPQAERGLNERGGSLSARVVADDITGEDGLVEITNGNLRVAGKILASDDDTFIVEWEDERRTVESKADYDLVLTAASEVVIPVCENCGSNQYQGDKGLLCPNCDGSHESGPKTN